jgi:hypothetical protein
LTKNAFVQEKFVPLENLWTGPQSTLLRKKFPKPLRDKPASVALVSDHYVVTVEATKKVVYVIPQSAFKKELNERMAEKVRIF